MCPGDDLRPSLSQTSAQSRFMAEFFRPDSREAGRSRDEPPDAARDFRSPASKPNLLKSERKLRGTSPRSEAGPAAHHSLAARMPLARWGAFGAPLGLRSVSTATARDTCALGAAGAMLGRSWGDAGAPLGYRSGAGRNTCCNDPRQNDGGKGDCRH